MTAIKNKPAKKETADREIVITRVINAPRELVFNAMTDPNQVVHWWGPKGFSTTIHEMDVRPGGVWKHTMRGPDGANYPNKSVFVEVVKNERIVYSHAGGKEEGGDGANFKASWTFETQDNKTRVTIRMIFMTAEARDRVVKQYNAIEGGKQTLGRLEEYLNQPREFVITRTFDAPRELVWKAWTERDRLMQWFGPKGFTMSTAKLDLRPGGMFHYCLKSADGHEMWGKFVYREIEAPERIVLVNSFSDAKGGITRHPMSPTWPQEMLSTTTFAEHEGKTTITIRWAPLNASEAERQTFDTNHENMQKGWTGTFEQLAAYLKEQK